MASIAQLRVAYPDFSDVTQYPDTLLQAWLDAAIRLADYAVLGSVYDDAVYCLALHLLTSQAGARGRGARSVTAGPASITYGAATTQAGLDATAFGQTYAMYCRTRAGGGVC